MADATFTPLENKVWLANAWGNNLIIYYKTNKEALTCAVFCCKALRKRQSTQEVGKNTRLRLVFSPAYTSFMLYRFLRALQQNTAQSRLLYLLNISFPLNSSKFVSAVIYRPTWNQRDSYHEIKGSDQIPHPLSYLPTLPVFPAGVSKFFIQSPGLPVRAPNLPGNTFRSFFNFFHSFQVK